MDEEGILSTYAESSCSDVYNENSRTDVYNENSSSGVGNDRSSYDVDYESSISDYNYVNECGQADDQLMDEEIHDGTETSSSDDDFKSSNSNYSDVNEYGLAADEHIDDEIQEDSENSNSDNSNFDEYRLTFDEIKEEYIKEEGQGRKRQRKDKTDAFCDACFTKDRFFEKKVAFYLCYLCEQYLCNTCFKGHETHKCIHLVSGEIDTDGEIETFLDVMRNESDREKTFEREDVSLVDNVKVRHRLDESECLITGICGLSNASWVICDKINSCIKIFKFGSNNLQRYFRFGSEPFDVTEVKFDRESTAQGLISTHELAKQCILAVTLPLVKHILFINVTQNSDVKTKSIKTEKACYLLDFTDNKIVTVCREGTDGCYWYVSVMSTNGVMLETIKTDLFTDDPPHLAVCPGRIFIADWYNKNVFCMDHEGQVVAHITMEGSDPSGICVDPDANKVYICDNGHNELYRLDYSFECLESLLDLRSVHLEYYDALLFYRNILFFSDGEIITLVRVL